MCTNTSELDGKRRDEILQRVNGLQRSDSSGDSGATGQTWLWAAERAAIVGGGLQR